jgi:hypothetical protein
MFDFIEAGRDAQAIYDALLGVFMAFSWIM